MTSLPHRLLLLLATAAIALVAATGASADARQTLTRVASQECPGANLVPDASNLSVVLDATSCLIDRERARSGVAGLSRRSVLRRMASGYARQMVQEGFFGHVTPAGAGFGQRIAVSGYPPRRGAWRAGENLAWGTGPMATPRDVVRRWLASPPHRRNLLDRRFRETGIGIALGTPGTDSRGRPSATYVQELGARG